jgi:two-component system nitrate/nitrite response regulator NarL
MIRCSGGTAPGVSVPSPSRLALIDHHPLFVHGLELLLPAISDGRFQVVGSTNDAAAAAALVRRCLPDLALVDLQLPSPGGVRAVAAIRRAVPRLRVIAMADPEEPTLAVAALRAGAEGCLPKTSQAEDLMPPLLAALSGWAVLPANLLDTLLQRSRHSPPAHGLDEEERRLLRLIAAGHHTVHIADQLHVSERTVKRLTAALLRKLRVANRTQAAAAAGSAGLL